MIAQASDIAKKGQQMLIATAAGGDPLLDVCAEIKRIKSRKPDFPQLA